MSSKWENVFDKYMITKNRALLSGVDESIIFICESIYDDAVENYLTDPGIDVCIDKIMSAIEILNKAIMQNGKA